VETSPDPDLASIRRIFEARRKIPALDERLPGAILPVPSSPPPAEPGLRESGTRPRREENPGRGDRDPDRPPPENGRPPARRPLRDHVVVRLDARILATETLPRFAEREFGGRGGLAYGITVSLTTPPHSVLFRGGPLPVSTETSEGDVSRTFFSIPRPGDAPEPGKWTLFVHHPSGSLEEAVAGARRRNLSVSLAILAILASTVVLLLVSTRRAQRLARQQMDFVAGVSHELKTPLTAMRSAAQNLADGIVSDPEKVRRYGALIEREGRRLTEMVGRVLTFSGLQAGAPALQRQAVSVATLVNDVLSDFRFVLEERGVKVEKKVAENLPPVVGDPTSLRQALANLIDNAVKYGDPSKGIGLEAQLTPAASGGQVVLSVSDHGPGIRKSDQRHVFDPFFRGADTGGVGGSGLGLAVVRGIVEAHGGQVSVESASGKGSRFVIRLPVMPEKGGRA
ncbi:MAG: HAMP domain-containing histidine kinase, partial [Thermoanaerobaculia bacterium]|nr:HAMP domain-containing histidine kinase [Thermoanaerobaculia bacterium]